MSNSFREDWQRGTILLVSLVALGIVGAIFVYLFAGATPAPVGPLCSDDSKQIERVKELVQGGLDNALQDHTEHLMSIWIRDNVDVASRAGIGMRNGARAYFHARQQIADWVIPPCREQVK
jgi:hypothetical protein